MKLGLMLVVAVALMVPSLSEGRTVGKCELKHQLEEALVLPRRLQRRKERILAIVVCEATRRSRLDTALVTVFGKRTTTTAKPSTRPTKPVQPIGLTKPVQPIGPTTPVQPIGPTKPVQPTGPTKLVQPTETTVVPRQKLAYSSEEVMREEEDEDEEEQDISMMGSEEMEEEDGQKGDEDELDVEEGGECRKSALRVSFGRYGLFQLSDRDFCDSGYRSSKNRCRTSCTAFTDDDITDDVRCLVKSRYLWTLLKKASRSCRGKKVWNSLKECK